MNRHELGKLLDGVDYGSSEHFHIYTMLDPVKFYGIVSSGLSHQKFVELCSEEMDSLVEFNLRKRRKPKQFKSKNIIEKRILRDCAWTSQILLREGSAIEQNVLIISSKTARILGFWFHLPNATTGKVCIRVTTLEEHPKRAEEVINTIRSRLAPFLEN